MAIVAFVSRGPWISIIFLFSYFFFDCYSYPQLLCSVWKYWMKWGYDSHGPQIRTLFYLLFYAFLMYRSGYIPRSRDRLCPSCIVLSLLSKRAAVCRRNSANFCCLAIFSFAKFSNSSSISLSFRFKFYKTHSKQLISYLNKIEIGLFFFLKKECLVYLRKCICLQLTGFVGWTSFSLHSSTAAVSSMFRSIPSSGHGDSSPICCAPHAFRP